MRALAGAPAGINTSAVSFKYHLCANARETCRSQRLSIGQTCSQTARPASDLREDRCCSGSAWHPKLFFDRIYISYADATLAHR